MTRDARQEESKKKFIENKLDGILDGCTGYGKTKVAGDVLIWANEIWENQGHFGKCNVIVPTNPIKEQWEKFAKYLNLSNIKIDIFVINGLVKNEINLSNSDITIYDELHWYPLGKEFNKIFHLTDTKYRIGLSGTMGKKHKEALLRLYRPLKVIDTVKIEEAEFYGWCAKTIRYNLVVDYDEEDKKRYDKINAIFNDNASYFENNFEYIIGCSSFITREINGKTYVGAKDYTKRLYSEGHIISNENGELTEQEACKYLNQKANIARHYMQERKNYINKANVKINATVELLYKMRLKAITFGVSTEVADIVTEKLNELGIKSLAFHSNLKTEEVLESELMRHGIIENKTINLFKTVKCGKDRLQDLYISKFANNEIQILNSAKALELGFDAPEVTVGVVVSGDSDADGYRQIEGRSCRKEKIIWKGKEIDKIACVVNIVIRDSKDETWVKYRQAGKKGINTFYKVDDIVKDFHSILDSQIQLC